MKGLGRRLATARKAAGYSQTDAAELINVSFSTIGCWERDRSEPGLDNLHRLADLYGVAAADLIRKATPNDESPLGVIHEAARLLSVETGTDKILELVDRIKLGAAALLKEKRMRCLAVDDED